MDVDFDELEHHELIHIHKVSTRGRKCETRVIGIPECFDYKKILKFWKNVLVSIVRISKQTDDCAGRVSNQRRRRKKSRRTRRRETRTK